MSDGPVEDVALVGPLAARPDLDAVQRALENLPAERYESALTALVGQIRDVGGAAAWVDELRRRAFQPASHFVRGNGRAALAIERRRWEDTNDPFTILNGSGGPSILDPLALRLLWRLDAPAWCQTIDEHALPSLIGEAAFHTTATFAELVGVLPTVPRVYTSGAVWTRSIAAIVLVDRALDVLDARVRSEASAFEGPWPPNPVDPWQPDVHRDLVALTAALDARSDGHLLALGFLERSLSPAPESGARLVLTEHSRRWAPHLRNLLRRRPIDSATLRALLDARAPRRVRDEWVYGSRRKGRAHDARGGSYFHTLSAAATARVGGFEPADAEAMWCLVVRALAAGDAEAHERFVPDPSGNWVPRWSALASVLAGHPDPIAAFERAREAVEALVERVSRDALDIEAKNPVIVLGLLAACTAAESRASAAAGWADELHGRAWSLLVRLWAFGRRDSSGETDLALLVCAELGFIGAPPLDASRAAALLKPLLLRPIVCVRALRRLHLRGATRDTIRAALKLIGTDLDALIEDAMEARRVETIPLASQPDVDVSLALFSQRANQRPSHATAPVEGAGLLRRRDDVALWKVGPLDALAAAHGVDRAITVVTSGAEFSLASLRRAVDSVPRERDDLDPEIVVAVGARTPALTPEGVVMWGGSGGESALTAAVSESLRRRDPFDRRLPVRGYLHFGRRTFVDDIATRICSARVMGVFGLRRVGKTSAVQAALDQSRAAVAPVWVDVQGILRRDEMGVASAVARAVLLAGGDRRHIEAARDTGAARLFSASLEALTSLAAAGAKVPCVVFDEFDLLFADGERERGARLDLLLGPLAAASNAGHLAWVAIGRDARRFQDARALDADARCLVGQMDARWLPPLTRAEAHEMLERLGRRAGVAVPDDHVDAAYRAIGGHPLLLRLYGRELFDAVRGGTPRPSATAIRERWLRRDDVALLIGDALGLVAACFPEDWRRAAPSLMGRGGAVSVRDATWREAFERFGLIREDGELPEALRELAPSVGPVVPEAA